MPFSSDLVGFKSVYAEIVHLVGLLAKATGRSLETGKDKMV